MAQFVTEIAYLPLKPGTDLTTGDNERIWNNTLKTVSSQPGCKAVYWGHQVEHPYMIQMHVDWETYDDHKAFMDSPAYPPFMKEVGSLLSGGATIFHVPFPTTSPFSKPGKSNITECISLFFEPSHSTADYDKNWAKFVEGVAKSGKEAQGVAGGWAIEEQKHKLEKDGGELPAKLFVGFVGWPSVDAHMKYREQKDFGEVIKWLRDGPRSLEVHHVEFNRH